MARSTVRIAIIALTILADAGLGLAAAQADVPTVPSARVVYADLDLGSQAGRHTLNRRLDGAVTRVCPTDGSGARFADQACRREAMQRARADLHKAGVVSF